MTWRKTGAEFDDECAAVDLSDAAYRTHMEAIGYVYKMKDHDCKVPKSSLRRFATSKNAEQAIAELVAVGFWVDRGPHYVVAHHGDVIADSLDAQQAKRDRDRKAQQAHRDRLAKRQATQGVSADVIADTRQTDRQTDKQLGGRPQAVCQHGTPEGSKPDTWFPEGMACSACARERKSA